MLYALGFIGLFVHRHRTELHHIDPYPARAWNDLVQDASVSVVLICDKRDLGARDPGAGDDVAAAGLRADLSRWRIRPGDRRRPAIVPTFILVLLTPGGVCDDFAGVRRGQRDRSGILE